MSTNEKSIARSLKLDNAGNDYYTNANVFNRVERDDTQTSSITSDARPDSDVDPSGKLWSIYLSEAQPFDKALVDRWERSMDGILIFAGLFSAIVTAFIIDSYKRLQPDSGDATVVLLTQISQQLASLSNVSQANSTILFMTPNIYKPAKSMLYVNALWFLSLGSSLSCALFATLVEQWARLYALAIERRPAAHKRARIRSYLYEGLLTFRMSTVVKGIPTLLHASLFLFMVGLVIFLFSINTSIAYVSLPMFILCLVFYLVVTSLPLVSGNCPYQTPLSGSLWHILRLLHLLRFRELDVSYMGSMTETRQKLAMAFDPGREKRDFRALRWTLESLTEDTEFEPFVEGTPGFLRSKSAMNSHGVTVMNYLLSDRALGLADRIISLLRTCEEPYTIASQARPRRAASCFDAIWSLTTQSSISDVGTGDSGDWDSWCKRNPGHVVGDFLHDADPIISNAAFHTMMVLVIQLSQKYVILPQVTNDDLDQLRRHIVSGDSSSATDLSSRLHRQLHAAGVKGLQLLQLISCLMCTQTRAVHDRLRRKLRRTVDDAEMQLWNLTPRLPGLPSLAILSSMSVLASPATPMISQEAAQQLTHVRQAVQQLDRLRYVLEEARFELVERYTSHLTTESTVILSDQATETMRLTLSGLPNRAAHPHMQKSIADSLHDLIQWHESQSNSGGMGPAIDIVLGIVRYLSDEEPIQKVKDAILQYQTTNPHSYAAKEALRALQTLRSPKIHQTSVIAGPLVDSPTELDRQSPYDPPILGYGIASQHASSSSSPPAHRPRNILPTPPV